MDYGIQLYSVRDDYKNGEEFLKILEKGVFTPHYTIENRKSNGKTWSWGIDKRPKLCYDKV